MSKHLPDKSIETFQNELHYSNKSVILKGGKNDRRENNANNQKDRSDVYLDDRITKFHDLIGKTYIYGIHLRYIVDLELVNFPVKFDTKFSLNLETNYTKLFESRRKVTAIPTTQPDAKIIFHSTPYIQYKQIKLNDNFRKYLEASLKSKRVLRTGIVLSPYLKTYEINAGIQSYMVEFKGANEQFSFLEI